MSRQRSRRRSSARTSARTTGPRHAQERQAQALLLIGSFVVGALLEWLRAQPTNDNWGWQSDILAILVASWLSVSLVIWWPGGSVRDVPRRAGILLIVLFGGVVIMHELIRR